MTISRRSKIKEENVWMKGKERGSEKEKIKYE